MNKKDGKKDEDPKDLKKKIKKYSQSHNFLKNKVIFIIFIHLMVRLGRFELPQVALQRPQRCASTSSATTAYLYYKRS